MSRNEPHLEPDPAGEALRHAVEHQPGIVRARLDGPQRAVVIDYDAAKTSRKDIERIAREIQPAALAHFDKCLMRLHGRACEACAQKFERKARRIEGVQRATATFLGGIMTVTYDHGRLSPDQVVEQVQETGAPVSAYEVEPEPVTARQTLRVLFSGHGLEALFTATTLVAMMAGWVVLRRDGDPRIGYALYTLAYLAGGYFGVRSSIQSLRELTIDVDLLMVLAALGAAYVGAPFEGAMLLFLFSLSNVLQGYAISRTRKAITSLMKLRPDHALVRRNGETALLPVEQLEIGDVIIIRPGESVPLDGEVIEGASELDQSSLTGESMPVMKQVGDPVFAATINRTGALEVCVTRTARDSTIAKLIRMVEEAQSEKAHTQRFLERAEQYYAMGVIVATLLLIVVPLWLGGDSFDRIFYRAMTVMVVASPCALIISTPATILSAIGGAARRGVLFKGGAYLEQLSRVRIVAFDKTGTLTTGRPRVTEVQVIGRAAQSPDRFDAESRRILALAASVESRSEHILAQAIVQAARDVGQPWPECARFQSTPGKGAVAHVNGQRVAIGNARYFEGMDVAGIDEADRTLRAFHQQGKTSVLVVETQDDGSRGRVLGLIAVADALRPGVAESIRRLKQQNHIEQVVLLTGDHEEVAASIADAAGVDAYHAGLLPEDKVRVVHELKKIGPVAMVGDGVNDAPALAAADVGIAMGAAGTDVAMETADVVLMSDQLRQIPFALAMSRRARTVVIQNLTFALSVISFLVVAALGLELPLTLGVIGHEGSTVIVCLNGLRLLVFRD